MKAWNSILWSVQILLALLFLFAGVMKLVMPIEAMTQQMPMPGWFLRAVGVAEALGALGLVLPGLFRVRPELTPLAATGLVVLMIGASALTLNGGAGVLVPIATGLLAALVVWGRGWILPHRADRLVRRIGAHA